MNERAPTFWWMVPTQKVHFKKRQHYSHIIDCAIEFLRIFDSNADLCGRSIQKWILQNSNKHPAFVWIDSMFASNQDCFMITLIKIIKWFYTNTDIMLF